MFWVRAHRYISFIPASSLFSCFAFFFVTLSSLVPLFPFPFPCRTPFVLLWGAPCVLSSTLSRCPLVPSLASTHFLFVLGTHGFVVPEKERGKWRLDVDYRQLNEATLPDAQPLPLIENMLENQSKHKIFTIVDLSKRFHRVPLHPESQAKTAMNLAGKQYPWRVMPNDFKNAPAIFQRVMDHVLQGLDCADVHVDGIIVGSSGETEGELLANHDHDVRAVLDRLRKEELVASVSNTNFFVRSVEFCGHVLENGTPRPAPGKMLALER